MEDNSEEGFKGRDNNKKGIVNENLNKKKRNIDLSNNKSSNSDKMKNIQSLREKFYFLNLITKESAINKIFFKRENISLKSSSLQKPEIKNLKKYRYFYIQKDKNEISNDIKLKKYDTKKISNQTLNIGNIDTKNNLKSKEKDFLINEK